MQISINICFDNFIVQGKILLLKDKKLSSGACGCILMYDEDFFIFQIFHKRGLTGIKKIKSEVFISCRYKKKEK